MRRLLWMLLIALPVFADETQRGKLTENVVTRGDSTQSYTLFLPSIYSPGRKLPLLLVFDPRSRGTVAARLFVDAAEEYGWIILSSNGTRSDEGAAEANEAALRALLPELPLYTPDPKRIYAAGFSGTAMTAWALGLHSGGLAGVIGACGRLVDGLPPDKFSFDWYGFSGDTDFNNRQMREIDAILDRAGKAHRFRQFAGEHSWMPRELVSDAFGWLELMAMKEGKRTRDEALIARLYARDTAASASATTPLEALRIHRAIVRTYSDLHDISESRAAVERLERDAEVKRALDDEAKWDRFEERFNKDVLGTTGALYTALRQDEMRPMTADITRGFRIAELKRHAAQPGAEGLTGRRLLESVFGQLAHYLRVRFIEQKEYLLAIITLEAATEIHPDRWSVWYNLSCARALAGDRRRALDSLEKAISLGFNDAKQLAADDDLASLRNEKRFKAAILALPSQ